ncbi:MAG: hypothetical protein ABJL74_08860 [Parasphingorhabdus sp.]
MAITNNQQAVAVILTLIASIPAELQEEYIKQASKTATPQIVGISQFIYAFRDYVPNDVLEAGMELTSYVTNMMWWGLQEGHGQTCMSLIRKALGEPEPDEGWPDAVPPLPACGIELPADDTPAELDIGEPELP